MTPLIHATVAGIPLPLIWIILAGVCGAVSGVIITSRAASLGHLVPFSSGLLLGMAIFLIVPEALTNAGTPVVLALCAGGCAIFGLLEATVHTVSEKVSGMVPLVLAVALHSFLDGWNIAIALMLPSERLIWAFVLGMTVHKLTSGFAIGAVFRAAAAERSSALAWAAACEAITGVGAILQLWSRSALGQQWTAWLIALTAGSFLYLSYHSFQNARAQSGLRNAAFPAAAGAVTVWFISLMKS
jgi:zinc transporter ZupT